MAGREEFRSRLLALGFDEVRFVSTADVPSNNLAGWLAGGNQADMHWIERSAEKRLDPHKVLTEAQSIVVLGVSYWRNQKREAPRGHSPADITALSGRPVWARYALHEDYHDTIKPALAAAGRLLEELFGAGPEDYRYYVDTGPVLERGWAARAGVGFVGKNTMLISRQHGNWLLLSSILTSMDFPPDSLPGGASSKSDRSKVGSLCGRCTRCLDACPTAAFPRPGVLDARRCISYQTIENKGIIPRELRPAIGDRIFGCDICLEVCPWNRFAREGRQLLLVTRGEIEGLSLRELLEITPAEFAERFRHTPIKRLTRPRLLRNACIVAGNSGDPALIEPLLRLVRNPSPLVRAHAVWAVRKLGGESLLAATRAEERDPVVIAEYGAVL